MATILPGGHIISGVGGRIWARDYTISENQTSPKFEDIINNAAPFNVKNGEVRALDGGIFGVEVADWRLSIRTNLASCPHTGTFGADCHRIVLDSWSFSASTPLDQRSPPDMTLTAETGNEITTHGQNISLAFKLGDVTINPEALQMGMGQQWYYGPSAYLREANPVLNASGDVIRTSFSGVGSGHLFLLPMEEEWCGTYLEYLRSMGWG